MPSGGVEVVVGDNDGWSFEIFCGRVSQVVDIEVFNVSQIKSPDGQIVLADGPH